WRSDRSNRDELMNQIQDLRSEVPIIASCNALGIPRATAYRSWSPPAPVEPPLVRQPHPRRLTEGEEIQVLGILHGDRFKDRSPAEVYATLLDEGKYLCSLRTMYRILEKHGENRERRAITRHGKYAKPELLATAPNQVWSWDITKLLGPQKWTYYYLYVLLDIFSRYVVGWMVADRESGVLAKALIAGACERQNIKEDTLTIHSDRGGPMTGKPVAFLMADLGITKSLNRPQVSNDNPFSEAQFKTLKYSSEFPERFGCKQDADAFCRSFFRWYNQEHKHSGIGYYTPEDIHNGRAKQMQELRQETLSAAFAAHPERFV